MLGFFLFAVRAVLQAWLLDATPPDLGGSAIGILFGAQAAGAAIGPICAGMLADHYGIMAAFYFLAAHHHRRQPDDLRDAVRGDQESLRSAKIVQPGSCRNAFASFIAADTLFGCAEDIIVVATGWLVFSKTRSTLRARHDRPCGLSALIAFSLLTGLATDRFDRRLVLAVCGAG